MEEDTAPLPNLFTPRTAFKPFEYPEVTAYKDAINHSYWLVTEWNFSTDAHDFRVTLSPSERTIIERTLLAISQIEVAVKRFWTNLGTWIPKPEFEQVGVTFGESEVRHADAYSHLLQVLGLNDQFAGLLEVPAIQERVAYLSKCLRPATSEREYLRSLAMFALFVENVSLFGQFAIIRSFNHHRQVLRDIDNVVQATQKEELVHASFGAHLVNLIKAEAPEWFSAQVELDLRAMCVKAYEAECKIIDWIFEEGEPDFLSAETTKAFVASRFDATLQDVGIAPVFDVTPSEITSLGWFSREMYAEVRADFFHKRPVTYSKMMHSITAEDLF